MKLSDFNYIYPEELVAQRPLPQRDASKMMVVSRSDRTSNHCHIKELPDFLNKGDLLIVNNSKVFPARLLGQKESGSEIEVLLLEEIEKDLWRAIASRKKRLKEGNIIQFDNDLAGKIIENRPDEVVIKLVSEKNVQEKIEEVGLPPLPPYIKRKTRNDYTEEDRERYQNIYAKEKGSAAAPTAGFHLSEAVLKSCTDKGVKIAEITLHVGMDTFSPVRSNNIEDHKMHGERYLISSETLKVIKETKAAGGRVVAVGTTSVRALESFPLPFGERLGEGENKSRSPSPRPSPKRGEGEDDQRFTLHDKTTNLFITPGYRFQVVDAMLTNFHQPKSTLLMMISAFAGRELVLQMYAEAIKRRYRLFSYGDCMLIL